MTMRMWAPVLVILAACGGADPGTDGGLYIPPGETGEVRDVPGTPDHGREAGTEDTGEEDADVATPGDPGQADLASFDPGPFDPGPFDPGTVDPGKDPGTTDPGTVDPGKTDPGPFDPGTATDPGPQEGVGGCDPCGMGTIAGTTCAPNLSSAVPYVKVWVDTVDCNGNPAHYQTYSDAKGNFTLEVPCGTQTVWMEKNSYKRNFTRWIDKGMTTTIRPADGCFQPTAARIAVITGDWDRIEYLIGTHLRMKHTDIDGNTGGGGFTTAGAEQAIAFLKDLGKMSEFDVIFIDCSDSSSAIMASGDGVQIRKNLEDWVKAGGSLYASDYAFSYIEDTWPNAINFPGDPYLIGGHQTVTGTVVDQDLAGFLAKDKVTINFDLGPIIAMDSAGAGTVVHIEAPIKELGSKVAPVMISFQPYAPDGGRVAYTNFHNEGQLVIGSDVVSILEYVVFLM